MSSRTVPKKREQYQSPTDIVRVLRFSASNKLPLPCMLTSISSHRGTASSCITKSRVSSAPRSSGKTAAQPEEKSSVRGLKACAVRKHVFAERAHAARDRSLSFFSGKRIARSRKCVKPSEVGDVFSGLLSQPLYDRQGARRRRAKQNICFVRRLLFGCYVLAAGSALRVPLCLTQKIHELDRAQGALGALVAGLAASALNGLLDVLCGDYAKENRNAVLEAGLSHAL